ncbi:nucleotide exchange factor GrpE [Phycicoccus sp. M110.8]|uniref:nucleotide exchange factor GrpE n=1 Tax=Phycicoccus sp. M110.8 TaxID=3075433 RepID=UPI0028FDB615|nr:nucleotide exchange factor GrpE [Phycicoccus sp. M110.8]MDU0313519.1 nucleotide exchange factor GrpE [Phycicoccus sp. M110.8]HET8769091.1 nucleotide exchange factor GrpE [Pedococcus sp.]
MTDQNPTADQPDGAEAMVGSEEFEPTTAEAAAAEQAAVADQQPAGETVTGGAGTSGSATGQGAGAEGSEVHPDTALAAERLTDLQRLQAEYVNYKRRVDRDRAVVQERAVRDVLETLLPVLDDISGAREHGDLTDGPFAKIADKLESTLGRFGLERYGAVGEEFDPNLHEALMHAAWPSDGSLSGDSTTVVQVLQPGYRAGEQVLRAARVAVADPE